MRKEQVEEWIENQKQSMYQANHFTINRYSKEYISIFDDTCNQLLDWLIQQGIIKGKLVVKKREM